ncbi:cytochrome oxidase putative small subunit CydP [Legionella londiniensis]|uniref:Uncharacterized protein n=1 Tax=Legionella londiniensis TaxID=45068 RepID=A0A0W0VSY9_9GAMM|nr:cytochrome oxidase putative small subunit CydP [Legionella londiniensis]KTD23246.1 hypothetical protein Llon_0131 [Legionella londiniensis]STX93742.1 Uncharacterised protein [Legionella londiniensis]
MKPLTRDVLVTLLVKFTLLTALWVLCFKGIEKPQKDARQWLLGSEVNKIQSTSPKHLQNIQIKEA